MLSLLPGNDKLADTHILFPEGVEQPVVIKTRHNLWGGHPR